MKKANRITVVVARFGSDPEKIELSKESTIEEVLRIAGIKLGCSEKVWVNGEKATIKDVLENGDNLLIVSPKEAGR